MNKYAGTQTEKNLEAAFAGESQARNKYTYFASKAKKEGYEQIAALFQKTADNEKEHAKLWFKELEGIGTTAENLAAAAAGENYEWTDMYEDFAKWLDAVLDSNMPIEGVAVNFNIYDEGDNEWSIQLAVTGSYNEEDDEWAYDEVFTSEEDIYTWNEEIDYDEVMSTTYKMIAEYLEKGKFSAEFKKYQAVTCGFIDGDLAKVYPNE